MRQGDGDLGARMLAAIEAANAPALVIGTDCPALTSSHLRAAADILRAGSDAVVFPAEDGGYVLIGMRAPERALFSQVNWSTPGVMDETRRRLRERGLTWQEPVTLWDLDLPEDLERLREIGLLRPDPVETVMNQGPRRGAPTGSHGFPRARDLGQPQNSRISVNPATIINAAAIRLGRSGSLRKTTAMAAPNRTLVSRSAATIAIGATVIAQIAMP